MAAAKIGVLSAELALRLNQWNEGFRQAAATVSQFQRDVQSKMAAVSGATSAIAASGSRLNLIAQPFRLLGRAASFAYSQLTSLHGVLGAIASASIIREGVGFNAMMEQAQMGFATLLKDGNRAAQFLEKMQRFAELTPFEFPQLQQAARLMLAFGFSAESVLPTVRVVGDAVAALGGGPDMIDRIIRALGQIRTKGRVQQEEMLQLAEAGIPAFEILQRKLGLTADQMQNLGKEGIDAGTAIKALVEGMSEFAGGAMERQATTLAGLWSTLRDNIRTLLGAVFTPLSNKLKEILPTLIAITAAFKDAAKSGGLLAGLKAILPSSVFERFYNIVETVRRGLENLSSAAAKSRSPFEIFASVLLTAAQVLATLFEWGTRVYRMIVDNWSKIVPILFAIAAGFAAMKIAQVAAAAVNALGIALKALQAIKAASTIWDLLRALAALITNPAGLVIGGLAAGIALLVAQSEWAKQKLQQFWNALVPKIDIQMPKLEPPKLDPKDFDIAGIDFGQGISKGVEDSKEDIVSTIVKAAREAAELAQLRLDIALQELKLAGFGEETARYIQRQREGLLAVRNALLDGANRLKAIMGSLTGEKRREAEIEMLRLQKEANDILFQIEENTKSLRPTFGLPAGIEPMTLLAFRSMQSGTRGLTIANASIVIQVSQLMSTADVNNMMTAIERALTSRLSLEVARR